MSSTKILITALAASTALAVAGFAYADQQPSPPQKMSPQEQKVEADMSKLSKDGANAFMDVAQARLAIFDGRTKDAKTFVDNADSTFDKAKGDRSIFIKAEADLKPPTDAAKAANAKAAKEMASNESSTDKAGGEKTETAKPIAWLPVDGDVILNEDFKIHPEKAAAVKDANDSLAKGDRKGAMEKLKLANVNMGVVVAAVPLKATLADVHQAAQDIDAGKYYEGSQELRMVQDSVHYDTLDVDAVPTNAKAAATASGAKADTSLPAASAKTKTN